MTSQPPPSSESTEPVSLLLHGCEAMTGIETKQYGGPPEIDLYVSPLGSWRYVYQIDGRPCGVLQVVSRNGRDGQIANVYVLPAFRRRGIASELLREARKTFHTVHHSEYLSTDARRWIAAVG